MILRMAFRNLTRHKKRTIITAIAISVGLMFFIYSDSMLVGIDKQTVQNLIWYETASLRMYNSEYTPDRQLFPVDRPIDSPENILEDLRGEYDISPRTVFLAEMLFYEEPYPVSGSMYGVIHAVTSSDDTVFRTFNDTDMPRQGEIVLGGWLAEDIRAEIGYPLTLLTRTRDGYFQTIDLEVSDIVYTPNQVTNRAAFMDIDYVNEMLDMQGAVTEISLALPVNTAIEDIEVLSKTLSDQYPQIDVLGWRDQAEDFIALAAAKQSATGFILMLVFIIVSVGISNTMLMAVQERKKEIGIMRAMGMRKKQIWMLFLAEAGGLGLVGGIIGLLFGGITVFFLVEVGIDYSWLIRDIDMPYRVTGVMRGAWNPPAFVNALLFGVVVSVLMTMLPVRRALKPTITETMRD